ncbi:FAD-dependent oxidoreductase [Nocardioides sp. ChNu-153]|uniref:FAD-dependent oxidoreductase n=1 Tax=unclassified Nocardioides TaxID=2615069 RepID=UPI002404B0C6|nr:MULTISPECIES: FAD-dependent oxidoreductase [unclassified Nocardioides]MDF9714586.1 FAD-dependent oxidoreductase [Nocardioides sp. ChNu-99]MDN7119881.1 FAD-dependent oxidoreductase [Nocardioides sp. ChNu-153]
MTHVITRSCCNDASCVPVCPVNCIHPTPDEPDYGTAEMLYIDPAECIDCGACVDACPVRAIQADYDLEGDAAQFEEVNARWFTDPAHADYPATAPVPPRRDWSAVAHPLRVAVVGSGPAACYATEELLAQRGLDVQVDVIERLPTPFGLVRYGIAPDHQDTKAVADVFATVLRRKGVRLLSNVEVGRDVTHAQLAERYHAVVYAVGALQERPLGVEGEDLPGVHSATDFVAWYNGHPDFAHLSFDLSCERVVVLGNGNVALDVARVLAQDPDALARTDVADHALEALRSSRVREVVVIGRRGPLEAAFTTPELIGLRSAPGLTVAVDPDQVAGARTDDVALQAKVDLLGEVAAAGVPADGGGRVVRLRFLASPRALLGDDRVTGVRLERNELVEAGGRAAAKGTGETEDLACGLVLKAVGYRGRPVADLPFDELRGVVPNAQGRVLVDDREQPGLYVTGWIKRGPSGVVGTNKACARQSVGLLLDDLRDGVLPVPAAGPGVADLADLLPDHVDLAGWKALDAHERTAGRAAGRPRVKVVAVERMLEVARAG